MINEEWAVDARAMDDETLNTALLLVKNRYDEGKQWLSYLYDAVATLQAEYDHRAANR